MVKRISLFFAYCLFFLLALMYFTPKKSVYFLFESEIKKYQVLISNEKITDKGFSLELQNTDLFIKSIKSAHAKEVNIKIFALYNSLTLQEIQLSSALASFMPLYIEELRFSYSLLNPLNITLYGVGEFGEAEGVFHILHKRLHVKVNPSDLMKKQYKNSMKELQKSQEGEYSYDKDF